LVESRTMCMSPRVRQRQDPATIDNETKFGRQHPKRAFRYKQLCELLGDPADIKQLSRVDARERADHEVGYRLHLWRRVEEPEPTDDIVQSRQGFFANAADLQVGAARQVD